MSCDLKPEDLEAYSAGETSPEMTASVASHLETCTQCREELERIGGEDALIAAALAMPSASEGRTRLVAELKPRAGSGILSRVLTVASAAAVLLAAGAILTILTRPPSGHPGGAAAGLEEADRLLESGDASGAAGIYQAAALKLRQGDRPADRLRALFGLGRARLAEGNHLEAWIAFEEVARRSDDEQLSSRARKEGLKALKKRVAESGGEFEKNVKDELERELQRS